LFRLKIQQLSDIRFLWSDFRRSLVTRAEKLMEIRSFIVKIPPASPVPKLYDFQVRPERILNVLRIGVVKV
jgi:hypothetical protein